MIYTKTFQLSDFEWIGNAKRVVEMICNAGKSSEFVELIEERFDHEGDTAADFEISKWVIDEVVSIMGRLGLTLDGKPLKKKFKVFYRITGTGSEEIEAETPEEARDKFIDEFWDSPGDPLVCIERDDVESVTPVCYDCGDGNTKDYEFSVEHEKEPGNAFPGPEMFALVKVRQEDSGHILPPEVRLFMTIERARIIMKFEFDSWLHACGEEAHMYQEPTDGIDTCYVNCKDGTFARWFIAKSKSGM